MPEAREAQTYAIYGFRLEVGQRRLVGPDGAPIELPSRAFDLLLYMVERPGELLEKSRLLKAVWPTTVVEEGNLSQCIHALRRALGEQAGEQKFIVTVPGRGYQFVAPVTVFAGDPVPGPAPADIVENPSAPLAPDTTASMGPATARATTDVRNARTRYGFAAAAVAALVILAGYLLWNRQTGGEAGLVDGERRSEPLRSIVVLPFDDLSPQKDMEYFGDGIAEELMSTLGKLQGLQVVGRRSAFTFKNRNEDVRAIGAALNVECVLEGSVRRDGERLRISVQLSRASDGYSLWSETYDRKLHDVLEVQGSIAREVARALNPLFDTGQTIASRVRTQDPEAYASYLRGVFFYGRFDQEHALEEFQRATTLDPQFAMAFARLARCYEDAASGSKDNESFKAKADAAILQALKLDPSLEDVWWIYSIRHREAPVWSEVIPRLERAVAEDSSDSDSMLHLGRAYTVFGRREEALAMLERAHRADPKWGGSIWALAFLTYSFKGDRQRFIELTDALERVNPGSVEPYYMRWSLSYYEGNALDWDHYAAKLIELTPRDPELHSVLARRYAALGLMDAAGYHTQQALKLARSNPSVAHDLARIQLRSVGNIAAAERIAVDIQRQHPTDLWALLTRAELQYFTGDCAGALVNQLRANPTLGNPPESLDIAAAGDWEVAPIHMWCLRQQGKLARLSEILQAWDTGAGPPTSPDVDLIRARTYAARGDRDGLIENLRRLVNGKSPASPFSIQEPMFQAYLRDAEVMALMATLDARRAEWRRIIPKSSMKVPIPDAPKASGS